MTCPTCDLALREDENLSPYDAGGQKGWGCPSCCAEAEGRESPPPRTYPKGSRVPKVGDRDILICSVCRRALRRGDPAQILRVKESDPPDPRGLDVPCGGLLACPECVRVWQPLVKARLVIEGLVAADAAPDWLPEGGWLG